MTIKEIRYVTGLTQAAFSDKYNIPIRTIQNWEKRNNCLPYVRELLEFRVKYDLEHN